MPPATFLGAIQCITIKITDMDYLGTVDHCTGGYSVLVQQLCSLSGAFLVKHDICI